MQKSVLHLESFQWNFQAINVHIYCLEGVRYPSRVKPIVRTASQLRNARIFGKIVGSIATDNSANHHYICSYLFAIFLSLNT